MKALGRQVEISRVVWLFPAALVAHNLHLHRVPH